MYLKFVGATYCFSDLGREMSTTPTGAQPTFLVQYRNDSDRLLYLPITTAA